MTDLVAILSTGKGTWAKVIKLINGEEWNQVFLITNEFGKENFNNPDNTELILVDSRKSIEVLLEDIKKNLEGKLSGTEIAVNFSSGTGKEHMALLSAILNLGFGARIVTHTEEGVKTLF